MNKATVFFTVDIKLNESRLLLLDLSGLIPHFNYRILMLNFVAYILVSNSCVVGNSLMFGFIL